MCSKPKIPKPQSNQDDSEPQWLRNPYLDAAIGQSSTVSQLRRGRSSLRIDLDKSSLAVGPPNPVPGIKDPTRPRTAPNSLPTVTHTPTPSPSLIRPSPTRIPSRSPRNPGLSINKH